MGSNEFLFAKNTITKEEHITMRKNRSALSKELAQMYINEGLTIAEIRERTGIEEWTIKRLLHDGGYVKLQRSKKLRDRNPYLEYMDSTHVIYNGQMYERLINRKETVRLLMQEQRKMQRRVAN